jgi:hypothetical protein
LSFTLLPKISLIWGGDADCRRTPRAKSNDSPNRTVEAFGFARHADPDKVLSSICGRYRAAEPARDEPEEMLACCHA